MLPPLMLGPKSPRNLDRRGLLYEQWAAMLEAGLPVVRSLNSLGRSVSSGRDRRALSRVVARTEQGATLQDAVEMEGNWLDHLDQAVIGMGERTGRTEIALRTLAAAKRSEAEALREIRSGLAYPLLVLHVALLVFLTLQLKTTLSILRISGLLILV